MSTDGSVCYLSAVAYKIWSHTQTTHTKDVKYRCFHTRQIVSYHAWARLLPRPLMVSFHISHVVVCLCTFAYAEQFANCQNTRRINQMHDLFMCVCYALQSVSELVQSTFMHNDFRL